MMARRLHRKSFKVEPRAQKELSSTSLMVSLQQVSTAYIIAQLEEFPPETLALLPLRIRRELLLSLPPADILQLEQTRVVNSIDMDEIWKVVSQRYDFELARQEYPQPAEWVGGPGYEPRRVQHTDPFPEAIETGLKAARKARISWKAYILACIYALLLHLQPFPVMDMTDHASSSYYHSEYGHGFLSGHDPSEFGLDILSRNFLILLQLLFCMQFFTVQQIRSLKCFPLVYFQQAQHRYARFFNSKVKLAELLRFLLDKCHIEPPESISIDNRYFVWNEAAVINELEPVIQQFFSRVKEVKLLAHCRYQPPSTGYGPRSPIDPMVAVRKHSWIFDAMLSCSTPMLQSITITEHVHNEGCIILPDFKFLKLVITMLAECFSASEGTPNSISKLSCLPYHRSLQHIYIVTDNACMAGVYIDLAAFHNIIGIIQKQNLVTFSLSGPRFEHSAEHLPDLPQALGSYFLPVFAPNLTSITFKHIRELPLSLLLWLIHKFLYSPANGHQEMIFDGLSIAYENVPTMQQFEHISSDRLALPHKSLILKINDMKASLFKLLSQFPSLFLDTLEIQFRIEFIGSKVSTNFDVQAIGAFVNHPMSQIQTRLYSLDLGRSYTSAVLNSTTKHSVVCEPLVVLIKALFSQPEHLSNVELKLNCWSAARCGSNIHELVSCLHTIWKDKGNGSKLRKIVVQANSRSLGRTHDRDATATELKLMSNTVEVNIVTGKLRKVVVQTNSRRLGGTHDRDATATELKYTVKVNRY